MKQPDHNKAYTLRDGEIYQEVDAIRLAIADRALDGFDGKPIMRRSAVWKFRPHSKGSDFTITSSGIQKDMKGTVHLSEAHFGLVKHVHESDNSWVGPIPSSRHFHTLSIRNLNDGEFQNILGISLPGFALMQNPQCFENGKIVTWADPHPPNTEVTFGLTVVQRDWRSFLNRSDCQAFVGLLTGDGNRFALISYNLNPLPDAKASLENMQRNLNLIRTPSEKFTDEELTVLFWIDRKPEDPIKIIELSGINYEIPHIRAQAQI